MSLRITNHSHKTEREKRVSPSELFHRYQEGESVTALSRRFVQSPHRVRTAIKKARFEYILDLPLDYVPSDDFVAPDAESRLLAPIPESRGSSATKKMSLGLPPDLTALYDTPLLTRGQERHLFRKYNYFKYRANRTRTGLDTDRPSMRQMDMVEQFHRQSVRTREHLVRANLRLVVSLVKKLASPMHELSELISQGNEALLKAIEWFDYSKGFKFSTYASRAIVNNVRRTIPSDWIHAARFQTCREEALQAKGDYRVDPVSRETLHAEHQRSVNRLLDQLDSREKKVISARFGLDYCQEPKTLREIGEQLGVTRERVRQLEKRALEKLRDAAESGDESLLN